MSRQVQCGLLSVTWSSDPNPDAHKRIHLRHLRGIGIGNKRCSVASKVVRTKMCPTQVRLVVMRTRPKSRFDISVFTPLTTLDINIVRYYRQRWLIETAFRDAKQHFEEFRRVVPENVFHCAVAESLGPARPFERPQISSPTSTGLIVVCFSTHTGDRHQARGRYPRYRPIASSVACHEIR